MSSAIDQLLILPLVGLVIGVVWLFGRSSSARFDDEAALRRVIDRDHPGFRPRAVALGRDQAAALALDINSREILLYFPHGGRAVGWRLPVDRLTGGRTRYEPDTDTLVIDTGDFTRSRVRVLLPRETPSAFRTIIDGDHE